MDNRNSGDWSDTAIVLELPWSSQSLDYRSYTDRFGETDVLSWALARLRRMSSPTARLLVSVERTDDATANSDIDHLGAKWQSVDRVGDAQGLALCVSAHSLSQAVVVELAAALCPLATLRELLSRHLGGRKAITIPKGMPLHRPPLVLSAASIHALGAGAIPGLPRDVRTAIAALEEVASNVELPAPLRVYRTELISREEQERLRWPVSVSLDKREDVATLRRIVEHGLDERGEILSHWTAVRTAEMAAHRTPWVPHNEGAPNVQVRGPQRVVFVSAPSAFSGAERVLTRLNRSLAKSPGGSWSTAALVAQPGTLTRQLARDGAEVFVAGRNFAVSSVTNWRYCRDVVQRLRPSVVHANSTIGVPCTVSICEYGVPLIQHVHVANRRLDELVEQMQVAAAVIVVSGFVRARVLRYAVDPAIVHVVHNGVAPSVVRAQHRTKARREICREFGLDERKHIILMVARISAEKRHDLVVDAVRTLWDGRQSYEVLFVGEDYGEDGTGTKLRHQIASAGLNTCVRLVGFRSDIDRLYAGSDVMVLPSEDDAFPQTILEAMARRLPVVAARSGGVPEMIEDGRSGVLVQPGDSSGLARALEEVLTDRALSRQLALNALRRCSQEFSETRQVERTLGVYRAVMPREAGGPV